VDASSLANKLRLLTLFRLLVAVIFLFAAFFGMRDEMQFLSQQGRELVYGAITALLLLCAVAAGLLERWTDPRRLVPLAYAHFVGDALFATALVTLTGGVESIFTFLYSLAIINASIVLYRRGGVFCALVNTLCLMLVAGGQMDMLGDIFYGLLADATLLWHEPGAAWRLQVIWPSLTVNTLAFFGIAFLSSYLAEQMQSADARARKHEAGLEELTSLHESIVSSLENGLMTLDANHGITFVNSQACQILDQDKDKLSQQSIKEVFPDLGRVLENPDKAQRSHTETTIQILRGRKNYLRWTISPLRNADDRQVGHLLLFIDITPMKELEEQMERSERLAALGRLAANIAHEIRNPLASMSGSIQLLADSLDVEGSERKLMDIVVRETEHLNDWISEFLDYARPREVNAEIVDLCELVSEVVAMLQHDERCRNVVLSTRLNDQCHFEGDRTRLRQVIWNLVLNAIEAVGDSGHVEVDVEAREDTLILSVRDDGPGIAPRDSRRIFEPFVTTKAKGTGLGLATVYRNIEEHHGTVRIDRDPELGGAAIIVSMPRRMKLGRSEL
jgi:two-component system, NtrC family, sensor histidine kinase PilS